MKTLTLNNKTLPALKIAVECAYDIQNDMLTDDIPLSVQEIRSMASRSDDQLCHEMKEIRADFNAKLELVESLAVLKNQLEKL